MELIVENKHLIYDFVYSTFFRQYQNESEYEKRLSAYKNKKDKHFLKTSELSSNSFYLEELYFLYRMSKENMHMLEDNIKDVDLIRYQKDVGHLYAIVKKVDPEIGQC